MALMQHLVSQKSRLHAQPGQRNLAVHCGPGTPAPFMISAAASLLLVTPASAEASGPSISQPTINEQGLGKPELRGTITKQQSEFSLSSSLPAPPLLSSMDSLNKRDTRRHSQMFASTSKAPIQAEISHLHWLPIASLMESLSQPLPTYVYGLEAGAASLAASAIWMWQGRPVGWVQPGMLEVRPSQVAGKGLFTRVPVPCGTILGCYPGRVRSGSEMAAKIERAPGASGYVFNTGDGRFIDPTDASGEPSPFPGPGSPWPFPVEMLLPYANEPPKGAGGTNCFVETGSEGPTELIFQANRDIEAGEEVFIDYGLMYDRSSYRQS